MFCIRQASSSLFLRPLISVPSRFLPTRRIASHISRMVSTYTLPRLPIFEALAGHDPTSTVVVHSISGRKFTYGQLLRDVAEAKELLLREAPEGKNLNGERIAFLVENSYDYVGECIMPFLSKAVIIMFAIVTLLSILGTHSIALPLSPAFPAHELNYILNHSQASMLLSSAKFEAKATEVLSTELETSPKHIKLEKKLSSEEYKQVILEKCKNGDGAMMLYTSGTTNRPVISAMGLPLRFTNFWTERCTSPSECSHSASPIPNNSLGLLTLRSPPPRPTSSPHPWHHKRNPRSPPSRLLNRIPLPIQPHPGVEPFRHPFPSRSHHQTTHNVLHRRPHSL